MGNMVATRTRRSFTKGISLLVLVVVATALWAGPASAQEARVEDGAGAARLLELMNRDRAGAGIGPLAMRGDVTSVATGWSHRMADAGALSHNDDYFTSGSRQRLGAKSLGENVAYNESVDDAHARLMASSGHRANVLDPKFTVVGISVVRTPNGTNWVTQNFVQPNAAPVAAPVVAAPVAAAAAPTTTAAPAPTTTAAPAPTATAAPAPTTTEAPPAAVQVDELVLVPAPSVTPTSLEQSLTSGPLDSRVAEAGQVTSAEAVVRVIALAALALAAIRLERVLTGPTRARLRASRLHTELA
ncbi:MAG: CAP domain-containing protein [Acidimicrobiales bacterium]